MSPGRFFPRVPRGLLKDNSDLTRIAAQTQSDFDRIDKYRRAIELIGRLPP